MVCRLLNKTIKKTKKKKEKRKKNEFCRTTSTPWPRGNGRLRKTEIERYLCPGTRSGAAHFPMLLCGFYRRLDLLVASARAFELFPSPHTVSRFFGEILRPCPPAPGSDAVGFRTRHTIGQVLLFDGARPSRFVKLPGGPISIPLPPAQALGNLLGTLNGSRPPLSETARWEQSRLHILRVRTIQQAG